MHRNLKFHAIAVGVITFVVIAAYALIAPRAQDATGQALPREGERQVRIYSATWGANCNEEIERLNSTGSLTIRRDEQGNPLPPKRYEKIAEDNVLDAVSRLCNRRYTCDLRANSELLGTNPIEQCYKDLTITYRCDPFEKPTILTLNQGDSRTLDCATPLASNADAP